MQAEQTKRLRRVLLIAAAILLALVGYALFFQLAGFGFPCMLHVLTGLDCAGCGMSRACAAILRLDFADAFANNLMWPVYAGYALWVSLAWAIPYVRHGRWDVYPRPLWLHGVVLGSVVLYGILRNVV